MLASHINFISIDCQSVVRAPKFVSCYQSLFGGSFLNWTLTLMFACVGHTDFKKPAMPTHGLKIALDMEVVKHVINQAPKQNFK